MTRHRAEIRVNRRAPVKPKFRRAPVGWLTENVKGVGIASHPFFAHVGMGAPGSSPLRDFSGFLLGVPFRALPVDLRY